MARPSFGSLLTRRVATLALCGAVGIGVLAACNETPPQAKEHASISGVNATFGSIGVRNAQVILAANGNAAVTLALFNTAGDDKLIAVSSTAATSALLPGGENTDVTSTEGVFVTTSRPIILVGLKNPFLGTDVPVKLTFQNAGSVTLQIPISSSDSSLRVGPVNSGTSPSTSVSPSTTPSGNVQPTPTGSTSATPTSTPKP